MINQTIAHYKITGKLAEGLNAEKELNHRECRDHREKRKRMVSAIASLCPLVSLW